MRKPASIFVIALAGVVLPAWAVEPIMVSEGVIVEEAWARVGVSGDTEVFLVVNNRSVVEAVLGLQIPGATDVQVLGSAGRSIESAIPIHSELYMKPDGVRIVATGLLPSSTVSVEVTIGSGDPVVIKAQVLTDGQAVPDHHDYQHW
tara:strand:+ start:1820 stop:2260 length:441 start_codon:yes stop_codon:yes gene_type:complete